MNRNFERVPPELQDLKSDSLKNLYKYLSCRALALPASRKNGLQALQFSIKYAGYEPYKVNQFKLIVVLLLRSLLRILLPQTEQYLLSLGKKLKSNSVRL